MIHKSLLLNLEAVKCWNKNEQNCNVLSEYLPLNTDSRSYLSGQFFFALKGEVHDGFSHVKTVLSQKCPLVVFENNEFNQSLACLLAQEFPATIFIAVSNSFIALQDLAREHNKFWFTQHKPHHLIALSGSNGKTTTKEMLTFLFNEVLPGKIISTYKNNNNHIGVPLTILSIDPRQTEVAIVEYGSNHQGEMQVLCHLSYPTAGITTNIGHTHMEFFPTVKDVFDEESQIFTAVMTTTHNQGLFLINADDEFLVKLPMMKNCLQFSAINQAIPLYYEMLAVNKVCIHDQYLTPAVKVVLQNDFIMGEHNFLNLANAYVIASRLYPALAEKLQKAATRFQPTHNRSQWLDGQWGEKILLDAYNANPSSMKAALQSFHRYCLALKASMEDILIILGDMRELGSDKEEMYHEDLGKFVKVLKFPHVFYVGKMNKAFMAGLGRPCDFAEDVVTALDKIHVQMKNKRYIFIKASRSLQLEKIVGITKV